MGTGLARVVVTWGSTLNSAPEASDMQVFDERLRSNHHGRDVSEDIQYRHLLDPGWAYTRGAIIQRVFAHDVYHAAELNEILGNADLPQMDLWDW